MTEFEQVGNPLRLHRKNSMAVSTGIVDAYIRGAVVLT